MDRSQAACSTAIARDQSDELFQLVGRPIRKYFQGYGYFLVRMIYSCLHFVNLSMCSHLLLMLFPTLLPKRIDTCLSSPFPLLLSNPYRWKSYFYCYWLIATRISSIPRSYDVSFGKYIKLTWLRIAKRDFVSSQYPLREHNKIFVYLHIPYNPSHTQICIDVHYTVYTIYICVCLYVYMCLFRIP